MSPAIEPKVYLNYNSEPVIIYGKGYKHYHALAAEASTIRLVNLDSLKGLRPCLRNGEPYPPKRAASFYLHHTVREVGKRAKKILRSLVARQPKEGKLK